MKQQTVCARSLRGASARWLLAILAGALWVGGCSRSPANPTTVILVSIDTLRSDRLSVYGHWRPTTPGLEALAEEAVVFESFIANGGGTLPSHLTMMTSLHPEVHGVDPQNGRTLAEPEETLAESFRSAGFATAAFADGGWMQGRFGFAQGFDVYDSAGGGFEAILPKAKAWLAANHDRRSFLFLHTYDVHSSAGELPYSCPGQHQHRYVAPDSADLDPWRGRSGASRTLAAWNQEIRSGRASAGTFLTPPQIEAMRALYDGCIHYVDRQISSLVGYLREAGMYGRTLLVITSDHGEEIAEHGLFLHSRSGYEEIARIPLLVKLPFSRAAGSRVAGLAAMVDLAPTVLEIAGLERPSRMQGSSLLPALESGAAIRQATHIQQTIVRGDSWKYFAGESVLYDLRTDPRETTDVAAEQPSLVESARRYLDWAKSVDRLARESGPSSESRLTLSVEETRALESLGYVQ
jgi:arylsulfatase A-like enzyme